MFVIVVLIKPLLTSILKVWLFYWVAMSKRTFGCSLATKVINHFFPPASPDRDIEIIRPLYSVEVIETETARFDIEISEEGVHGNWKLKGEPLTESPVSRYFKMFLTCGLTDCMELGCEGEADSCRN